MLRFVLVILLFVPLICSAQYTLSGKIINLYDKKPVEKASIFLSNTTVGTTSSDDGSYMLTNIKAGQYDVVVSAIGYETFYKTLKIDNSTTVPYIELTPKSIDLQAVVVKPDPFWKQNYQVFREEFLGRHEYSAECKIINPEVLNLEFDNASRVLSASSNDYLEIENKALGYTIKYQLTNFTKDYKAGSIFYAGNVLFIPMKGKPAQMRRWYKARLQAYLGSSQHYLRSALTNQLTAQGFKTMHLIRKPNPQRQPDNLIKAKLKMLRAAGKKGVPVIISKADSLTYWAQQNQLPKTVEYLITQPLRVDSLLSRTDQKGIYAISFDDLLYVVYTKREGNTGYQGASSLSAPDYPTTVVQFVYPHAFFDSNGVIVNPGSVVFEGTWGNDRIAKLLPVDYDPAEKEKDKNKKP